MKSRLYGELVIRGKPYVSSGLPCAASRTANYADVPVPASGVSMNIVVTIGRVNFHRSSLLRPVRIVGSTRRQWLKYEAIITKHLKHPGHVRALVAQD